MFSHHHHQTGITCSQTAGLVAGVTHLLAKDGPGRASTRVITGDRWLPLTTVAERIGMPNPIARLLARKCTLAIDNIESQSGPFAELSRSLEASLGVGQIMNVYVTAAGAPGAARHADGHDVAAFQLAGSKRWNVGVAASNESLVLLPGDMLVVAAGAPHETHSIGQGMSIHVAIHCGTEFRRGGAGFAGALHAAVDTYFNVRGRRSA